MRRQCYDGAATMSGHRSRVATKLLQEELRVLYTHCYGLALNMACADTIKQSKVTKDSLDITFEMTKLIKKTPRRDRCFEDEISPDTPGVRAVSHGQTLDLTLGFASGKRVWSNSLG